MEKRCVFALWWIIIFVIGVVILKFSPFFHVVWMLQDCNDLYILFVFQKYWWQYFPFLWFTFQFCSACANTKLCIWPVTKPPCLKPFQGWRKQKAPSMPLPLSFCFSPFAWPVLHFSCSGKFEFHNLEISSTKLFFQKATLRQFQNL